MLRELAELGRLAGSLSGRRSVIQCADMLDRVQSDAQSDRPGRSFRLYQIYPVSAVEIEVSPWSYDHNQKAVISTAKELGITVVAYSPLGRGYLTGQIKSLSDLPSGTRRDAPFAICISDRHGRVGVRARGCD